MDFEFYPTQHPRLVWKLAATFNQENIVDLVGSECGKDFQGYPLEAG